MESSDRINDEDDDEEMARKNKPSMNTQKQRHRRGSRGRVERNETEAAPVKPAPKSRAKKLVKIKLYRSQTKNAAYFCAFQGFQKHR